MNRYINANALAYLVVNNGDADFINKVTKLMIEAPSIDLKYGEWISNHDGSWNCSECGLRVFIYAKGNFCPNCGADMRGKDNE